jgi:hypothetical protein
MRFGDIFKWARHPVLGLGAYWDALSDGASLVLNGAGNLKCPTCLMGWLSLRIAISEEKLAAENQDADFELFTLQDIRIVCSKCSFETPLQTFVKEHLLVLAKGI